MTLREKIEARARQICINMDEHPEDRKATALWWDTSGDDMMKEDLRKIALDELMDLEL